MLNRLFLCLAVSLVLPVSLTFAQPVQSPQDVGAPDSINLVFSVLPSASPGQSAIQLDLYGFNDGGNITSASSGFHWDAQGLHLDSARPSPMVDTAFNFLKVLYYKNNIDSTNARQLLQFAGFRTQGVGIPSSPEPQLWGSYYFTADQWGEGDSIVVDTLTFSNGSKLLFCVGPGVSYAPRWEGPKVAYAESGSCCIGTLGNVDESADGLVTMGDLNVLIDHLYISLAPLSCPEAGDIDGDGYVSMGDQTAMIDHLYISLDPLPPCP